MDYGSYNFCLTCILIIIIILMVFRHKIDTFLNKVQECNMIDDRCYHVVEKFNKNEEAGEHLARLNLFNLRLMKYLRTKYVYEDIPLKWESYDPSYYRDLTLRLLSNYNPSALTENAPATSENTSYVEDKGKVFAVCLREKLSGNNLFHNDNLLQFVAMHEMAHLATKSIGHEPEFWINFKILLKNAKDAGLHEPVDYAKYPENYCSLNIDSNPYFTDWPS